MRPAHLLLALALALPSVPAALAQTAPAVTDTPTLLTLGAESTRFGSGERMGLMGGSLLFDAGRGWWWGPAVYGAASGQRGGFFVGGVELQHRWALRPGIDLTAGLYAGGGGGGNSPVGGGLMLRPALTVWHHMGGWQAGVSLSQVRFPSGDIRSSQAGLVLAWNDRFRHVSPTLAGQTVALGGRTGLGVDHLLITTGQYRPRRGGAKVGLIGARAVRGKGAWHVGIETAAAAQGGAAGYMEILGEAGVGWPLGDNFSLGVRGALGLGGGGGLATGGGVLGKLAAGGAWRLSRHWHLGAELGLVDALNGDFRASSLQLWLAMALEPDGPDTSVARYDWAATWQRNLKAQRRDGRRAPLDTVGLKINRWLTPHWYLSAQAHSAYAGGAGAYSIGLVGTGLATAPVARGWQWGAELLAGAAGGGGVDTAGGAIVQGLLWAGWTADGLNQWRLGVGQVRALRGELASPVLELSWSRAFGLGGR